MLLPLLWLLATQDPAAAPSPPAEAGAVAMVPIVPWRYYPDRAAEAGIEGSARVECRVTLEGRLDRCRTLEETPPGYGFGTAAIKWAERDARLKVKPDATGEEVFAFPLRFRMRR